jgi:hypothetical protein
MSAEKIALSELLTQEEVALKLRVSPKTLLNWRYQSRGPAYIKMGGIILYRPSDIEAYLEALIIRPVLGHSLKKKGGHVFDIKKINCSIRRKK